MIHWTKDLEFKLSKMKCHPKTHYIRITVKVLGIFIPGGEICCKSWTYMHSWGRLAIKNTSSLPSA